MKVSSRLTSFAGMYFVASKPFTSPAILEGNADASKRVMPVIPERPATMLPQASATPTPVGQTMPRPVTTTLRLDNSTPREERAACARGTSAQLTCALT